MRWTAAVSCLLLSSGATQASEWLLSTEELRQLEQGEVLVHTVGAPGRPEGEVRAAVQITAPSAFVFSTITDCEQALEYVPHLERCEILERAPDRAWEIVEQELDYGWHLPSLHYVFRAEYESSGRIHVTHVRGDLRENRAEWRLIPARDGVATIVTYQAHVVPRIYVPRWLMRRTLSQELPAMLEALRAYVEADSGH